MTFQSLLHTNGVCIPCYGPTAFLNDWGECTCEENNLLYQAEECIPCDSTNGVLSEDGVCECIDPQTMLLSDSTNLCIPCSADFGIQAADYKKVARYQDCNIITILKLSIMNLQ